jgi:nitrate reductase molybdenum cofactor assembly chaperone NarJ/NarW
MGLYLQFADLFDYPDPSLPARVEACIPEVTGFLPGATRFLEDFQRSLQELGISRLQEAYTSVFDFQPECTLNLSYHLFGEDQRRGIFLAKLKELYQVSGIETGTELPDHLYYLLRYVAIDLKSEESKAIINDCLLPAISNILQGMRGKSDPYRSLLNGLLLCLEHDSTGESISGGTDKHLGQVSVSAR